MSENHVTATSIATMSLSSVQAFFQALQLDIPIFETEANTATVALAAAAHGIEPGRIAKTLAFRLSDGRDVLVVARGDARIDNLKFKSALGNGKMPSQITRLLKQERRLR